jgi:hypothetical protein
MTSFSRRDDGIFSGNGHVSLEEIDMKFLQSMGERVGIHMMSASSGVHSQALSATVGGSCASSTRSEHQVFCIYFLFHLGVVWLRMRVGKTGGKRRATHVKR